MISDKKLERIEKLLGKDTLAEIEALDKAALESRIVAAESSMKQATEELEANEQYQHLKASLKALSSGLSDIKKRQNAVIAFVLHILESKGQ